MQTDLDRVVAETCSDFVQKLAGLNQEPYIREAIMKIAVRETAWAMLQVFDNQEALAEQLELMGELVREHREDETEENDDA